jgi:hypothetical protein
MPDDASDLARRLADQAEAVCRHYLSNGRREGSYWLVGDVENTPGRSLYVRLRSGDGARLAGKWTDAATGEHGDLLDLIGANQRLITLRDRLDEARRFLAMPRTEPASYTSYPAPAPTGSPEASRRLFAAAKPITGTVAEMYLHGRGLTDLRECGALRFHPRCWYRCDDDDQEGRARDAWPAMIAAVTDLEGHQTGAHRTWLDPSGAGKAPVSTPRRAMGHLLGHAVRFGRARDTMAAGEGIETVLSLRQVLPQMPMAAALSANHLAVLDLPDGLRRLYIASDGDAAGRCAAEALTQKATALGVETVVLTASQDDFNDDLRQLGRADLANAVRIQLIPEDVARFWTSTGSAGVSGTRGSMRRTG